MNLERPLLLAATAQSRMAGRRWRAQSVKAILAAIQLLFTGYMYSSTKAYIYHRVMNVHILLCVSV